MPKIDWKSLKVAQGPANRVPALVKSLACAHRVEAGVAFQGLRTALLKKGEWFSGTAPAVASLIEGMEAAPDKVLFLVLIADVLGADHVRAWLASTKELAPAPVASAAVERKAVLLRHAESTDPAVRGAAILALAMLPELSAEVVPRLVQLATADADEGVRASALIALGRLGEGDADARALVRERSEKEDSALTRGAATVARLRLEADGVALDSVAPGVEAWMMSWRSPAYDENLPRLPWFGRFDTTQPLAPTSAALLALARHRREERPLLELAFRIGTATTSGRAAVCAGELILELGGFASYRSKPGPHAYVALPEELDDGQRAVAKRFANTMLLPRAVLGLAAAGEARKRWLGLLPPGPLERLVTIPVGGVTKTLPVWRAWVELEQHRVYGNPVPPPLAGELTALDRWQAIIEMLLQTYGGGPRNVKDIDELLGSLPPGEALFDRGARLADDLGARLSEARGQGMSTWVPYAACALLLLPFVRAGRPLEPGWDSLVSLTTLPGTREILQAIPEGRREAIVWTAVAKRSDDDHKDLGEVVAVLDLTPSPRIAENVARRLNNEKVRAAFNSVGQLGPLLERIRALAETAPVMRDALATIAPN
jgi:hypothetical protein